MKAEKERPLEGKVGLVTGAGGGIGKAIARYLSAKGALSLAIYRVKPRIPAFAAV